MAEAVIIPASRAVPQTAPQPGHRVVDIQGLGLTFQTADGPVHALKDVTLQIEQGEFGSPAA